MAPKTSVPHFTTQSRTVLSGSEKAPVAEARGAKPAPLAARITVSVIVRRKTPVCTENLNPNVLTMKSAQYGARIYDAGSLNLARDRRIFVQ